MQIRLETTLTFEEYVTSRGWEQATLAACPLCPLGSCHLQRLGTYMRKVPAVSFVARYYCPEQHTTFGLLPDFYASRVPGTLDDIEHSILRPQFNDPRVHFAINCASKSCPPLLAEPYRGEVLDAQLDRAAADFLNRPGNYRLDGDRFYVSSIFKWFDEDFGNVLDFYSRYARGDLKQKLQAGRDRIKLAYLEYDWSLNGS